MRLTHDPESGCGGTPGCPFVALSRRGLGNETADYHMGCGAAASQRVLLRTAAPEWCPLRAGDVTVTRGRTANPECPACEGAGADEGKPLCQCAVAS